MAYINAKTSALIRKALKEKYPEIKFSVRIEHHSMLRVVIMESPYFENGVHKKLNHYWLHESYQGVTLDVLEGILAIIKDVGGWYDKSDPMTDYFNTAFYISMEVGAFDKPHKDTLNRAYNDWLASEVTA